jgi:hypothetical protein
MSGASTQGVGAAACANADVVIAVSAAAIESVFFEKSPRVEKSLGEESVGVEDWAMMHPPGGCSNFLNKSRTSFVRQYNASVRRRTFRRDFVIFRVRLRDYVAVSV